MYPYYQNVVPTKCLKYLSKFIRLIDRNTKCFCMYTLFISHCIYFFITPFFSSSALNTRRKTDLSLVWYCTVIHQFHESQYSKNLIMVKISKINIFNISNIQSKRSAKQNILKTVPQNRDVIIKKSKFFRTACYPGKM